MYRSLLPVDDESFTKLRNTNIFHRDWRSAFRGRAEDLLRISFPVTWLVEITTGSIVWSAAFLCSSSATARGVDDGSSNELGPPGAGRLLNRRFRWQIFYKCYDAQRPRGERALLLFCGLRLETRVEPDQLSQCLSFRAANRHAGCDTPLA